MRLATWNCRQGADAKRHAFALLAADVVVVPECGATPDLANELDVSFLWSGDYAPKGLGVIGFNGWRVEPLEAPVELPWVLPVRLLAPAGDYAFDLLAVWTRKRGENRPSYEVQIEQMIEAWAPRLAEGSTVIAGDLNCSVQGRARLPHAANLASLADLGLSSAYHRHFEQEPGTETSMTLRWGAQRRGYHCDYVLLPAALYDRVTSVSVGAMEEWVDSGLSDHCPVIVDFAA